MGARFNGGYCTKINAYTENLSAGYSISFWTYLYGTSISASIITIAYGAYVADTSNPAWTALAYRNLNGGAIAGVNNAAYANAANGTYPDSTAAHIVITYDKSNVKEYKNGSQVATGVATATPTTPTHMGMLGRDLTGEYDGTLSDIRIYNRGLTPAEVQAIYIARGRDNIFDGMRTRWALKESAPGVASVTTANFVKDDGLSSADYTWANTTGTYGEETNDGGRLKRRYR